MPNVYSSTFNCRVFKCSIPSPYDFQFIKNYVGDWWEAMEPFFWSQEHSEVKRTILPRQENGPHLSLSQINSRNSRLPERKPLMRGDARRRSCCITVLRKLWGRGLLISSVCCGKQWGGMVRKENILTCRKWKHFTFVKHGMLLTGSLGKSLNSFELYFPFDKMRVIISA